VVGGFGAPDGLGAGAKGGRTGALKLFTFSCLFFAYVVVGGLGAPDGLGALQLLFF